MRLTQFSNFAVRILMYAGLKGNGPSSIPEVAKAYGISHDHLKKAAAELCHLSVLEAVRGRSGGVRLTRHPDTISIGTVVRATEGSSSLVECFDPETNTCPLISHCRFRLALQEAQKAFFAVLDRHTLGDLIEDETALCGLIGLTGKRETPEVHCRTHPTGPTPYDSARQSDD
jgi:Rrf2 family nitric oxide-sensitive transcriptional repressor